MAECMKVNRGGGSSGGGQYSGRLFGVEWDGSSSPLWTRTDDSALFPDPVAAVNNGDGSSPFDTIMPWVGMQRVERAGGTMVKIPKYWYKWTRNGAKMKLQIANYPRHGFYTAPAHADRGDGKGERDYVYIGAFHCVNGLKSKTGEKPNTANTRNSYRVNIHNLGATIWQCDYAMFWTWAMLYLVEYANWDAQAVIGYGCGNNSSIENNGLCDAMLYHTGTDAATRDTYGHIRYRYIEGLWDNVFEWCDGIYFDADNMYCIKNPADFSDSSGGTLVAERVASGWGYITGWTNPSVVGYEYALYPNAFGGSDSTYVPDYCSNSIGGTAGVTLVTGYNFTQSKKAGAFCLSGQYSASSFDANRGSRIMELP